jgi:hypothetical protein
MIGSGVTLGRVTGGTVGDEASSPKSKMLVGLSVGGPATVRLKRGTPTTTADVATSNNLLTNHARFILPRLGWRDAKTSSEHDN